MTYQFTCQVQLLLSFISNIIVVCKANNIFQVTNFTENENTVKEKGQNLWAIPKWGFQEKVGSGIGQARCSVYSLLLPPHTPSRKVALENHAPLNRQNEGQMTPERVKQPSRDSLESDSLVWFPFIVASTVPEALNLWVSSGSQSENKKIWGKTERESQGSEIKQHHHLFRSWREVQKFLEELRQWVRRQGGQNQIGKSADGQNVKEFKAQLTVWQGFLCVHSNRAGRMTQVFRAVLDARLDLTILQCVLSNWVQAGLRTARAVETKR